VYNGKFSLDGIHESIQSSDLVLDFGPFINDLNSGIFTRVFKEENHIEFHPEFVSVRGKRYIGYHFIPVLKKMLERLEFNRLPSVDMSRYPVIKPLAVPTGGEVTMTSLVNIIGDFIKQDDILAVDTGTFVFSCSDIHFKKNNFLHIQLHFSSIGYALPAVIGIAIARKESNKPGRIILIEGDGACQMTAQELGTYVRQNLPITVLLLNNSGYTVERAIWGAEQEYNDITPGWQWTKLLSMFGGIEGNTCQSYQACDRKELISLLQSEQFAACKVPQLVEVMMPKYDYPLRMQQMIKYMAVFNRNQAEILAKELGEK
jgi:TPP-dependent 2-oxoacid decarboxylase